MYNIQEDWRSDYRDVGTIEGRLEAIQDAGGLQIRIRDYLYSKAIRCLIPDEMIDAALGNFRRRVEVAGLIHYRKNGRPISIEAHSIEALPDDDDLPTADDVRGILATTA